MTFFSLNGFQLAQIQQNVIYQFISDLLISVLSFTFGLYFKFFRNLLPAKTFLSFIKSPNKVPIYTQDYISHHSFDERIQAPINDILEFLHEFNKRGNILITDSNTKKSVDWNNGFIAIGVPEYNTVIKDIIETYPEFFYVPSNFLVSGFISTSSDFQISSTSKDFNGGSRGKSLGLILKVKNPDTKKMSLIIMGNSINSIRLASIALNKYWRYLFKRYGSSEFGCVFKSSQGNLDVPILINASRPKINFIARFWFFIFGSIISIGSPKVNINWTKEY